MRAGRLEQLAAPQELYARPATAFVADFVGLTNRLAATVRVGTRRTCSGPACRCCPGSAHVRGRRPSWSGPEALAVTEDPRRHRHRRHARASSAPSAGSRRGPTAGETVIAQIDNAAVTGFSPGDRVTITPRPDAGAGRLGRLTRTRLPQRQVRPARLRRVTDTSATPGTARSLDDPAADPFEVARQAAAVIAERTGSATHDVALVLGSGWGQTGDLIGETLATVDNADVPGFAQGRRRRALGRACARSPSATPAGGRSSTAPAPTSTRAAACARSCTACAPPRPPAADDRAHQRLRRAQPGLGARAPRS